MKINLNEVLKSYSNQQDIINVVQGVQIPITWGIVLSQKILPNAVSSSKLSNDVYKKIANGIKKCEPKPEEAVINLEAKEAAILLEWVYKTELHPEVGGTIIDALNGDI